MEITEQIKACIELCNICNHQANSCAQQCELMGGMEEAAKKARECAVACLAHSTQMAEGNHTGAAECIRTCLALIPEADNVNRHLDSCAQTAVTCRKLIECCGVLESQGVVKL